MATKKIELAAAKREGSGKGTARALRRENRIPAVIYGDNKAPVMISLEEKPITQEYYKGHLFTALCDLAVEGDKTHMVITRDLQLDPVTDRIVHADFLRVTAKTVLRVDVPVQFAGQDDSADLKGGATLAISMHEVALMCPANAIPDSITVDVSGAKTGDSFKLSDVTLPKGVKPVATNPEEVTIAAIHTSRAQADASKADTTAEGDAAETPAEDAAA